MKKSCNKCPFYDDGNCKDIGELTCLVEIFLAELESPKHQKSKDKIIEELRIDNRVLRDVVDELTSRLSHLMRSEFIAGFDAKSNMTGKYLLDINDADKIAKLGLERYGVVDE